MLTPSGPPLWVETSQLHDGLFIHKRDIPAWNHFPLEVGQGNGPKAGFTRVIALSDMDKPVTEADGTRWWQVEVGTDDGTAAIDWAREKDHPKYAYAHHGTGRVSVSLANLPSNDAMHAHSVEVNGESQPGEDFKATTDQVDGSLLFRRLRRAMDVDQKDGINRDELRNALQHPWLAQAISHLIVHYESEWGGEIPSGPLWTRI